MDVGKEYRDRFVEKANERARARAREHSQSINPVADDEDGCQREREVAREKIWVISKLFERVRYYFAFHRGGESSEEA